MKLVYMSLLTLITMSCDQEYYNTPLKPIPAKYEVQYHHGYGANGMNLNVDRQLFDQHGDDLVEAVKHWNSVLGRGFISIQSTAESLLFNEASAFAYVDDSVTNVYCSYDWNYGKGDKTVAVAVSEGLNVNGESYIANADMIVNCESYFGFTSVNMTELFVHEIGHMLGLDHTDNPNSVMYPILSGWFLGFDDEVLENINYLYGR